LPQLHQREKTILLLLLVAILTPFAVPHARADLLVGSFSSHEVKRYVGTSGAFLADFISADSSGLTCPNGLAFGPDGHLYVSSRNVGEHTGVVKRYDGTIGQFLGDLDYDCTVTEPTGLVFGPDGNLYVSSLISNSVARFDGTTGECLGNFIAPDSGGLE
jgi:sugar lactone lactonase YvrE